jgi:hypothetical protein
MNMKSVRLLLAFFAIIISFFSSALATAQVTANALTPDRLEIMRTTGISNHIPPHEMVTQLGPVQDLYADMLSLPAAPADQICPQYIIANYKLTFYSNDKVVQKANVLQGECQPVTLGSDDIRTADAKFWGLLNKAIAAGTPISASGDKNISSISKCNRA